MMDEELDGLVIVFRDHLLKFNFSINDLVVQTEIDKIDLEFFHEFIIIIKPGGFLV